MLKQLSFVVIVLFAFSCQSENLEEQYPDECADFPTENLYYNDEIKALIDLRCGNESCHVPNSPIGQADYTNYGNVKSAIDRGSFQTRVFEQKDMPPNQQLSPCEMSQLEAWVADGYPENR